MSGHSHWAGIKHKKALVDAKRGKLWSKLAKSIIVAASHGGGNPADNIRLRKAIDEAKAVSMPNDNITRAIKRGTGELDPVEYVEVVYEGYGQGGAAFIAAGLTDNRNRTAPEIRKIFEVCGGNLGATGCVSWNFDKKGIFEVPKEQADEEKMMELVLEVGADDFEDQDDLWQVTCAPENFDQVALGLEQAGINPSHSEISMVAKDSVTINDLSIARSVMRLMDALDDHEDIQTVSANFTIADDILAQLEED